MGYGRRRKWKRKGNRKKGLKIWIKLIIFGIMIFFAGVFYITVMGGSVISSPGMIISLIGVILMVVGILSGLTRGYNKMMRE